MPPSPLTRPQIVQDILVIDGSLHAIVIVVRDIHPIRQRAGQTASQAIPGQRIGHGRAATRIDHLGKETLQFVGWPGLWSTVIVAG
jgi:hypothetical protein